MMVTLIELFGCAIVFAVWALFTALDWADGGWATVVFLSAASVAFAVAELKRMELRERGKSRD